MGIDPIRVAAAVCLHSDYEPCKEGKQRASLGLPFPGLGTAAHQLNTSCHQQGLARHSFHCRVTSRGTPKLVQQLLITDAEQDLLQAVMFCRAFAQGRDDLGNT